MFFKKSKKEISTARKKNQIVFSHISFRPGLGSSLNSVTDKKHCLANCSLIFTLDSRNCVIKNIALSAKSSSSFDFRHNYRCLSYKCNIGIHVWNLLISKQYMSFDLYLSHNPAVNPDGVFIRELCLFRDDYSPIDNNDITTEVLSHIIKYL